MQLCKCLGHSRLLMIGVGRMMVMFFLLIVLVMSYGFTFDLGLTLYLEYQDYKISIGLYLLSNWLAFNVVFNFVLAVRTDPGNTTQFEQDYAEQFHLLHNICPDIKECKHCKRVKVQRSHHCTICNRCIFKMDHHCPWINNCVGHHNLRYFLLMVLYCWLCIILQTIVIIFILKSPHLKQILLSIKSPIYLINAQMTFVFLVIFGCFNAWNWFLAVKGHTVIEYWGLRLEDDDERKGNRYDYSLERVRENIETVFGTSSLWKVMMPSLRPLTLHGYVWDEAEQEQVEVARRYSQNRNYQEQTALLELQQDIYETELP